MCFMTVLALVDKDSLSGADTKGPYDLLRTRRSSVELPGPLWQVGSLRKAHAGGIYVHTDPRRANPEEHPPKLRPVDVSKCRDWHNSGILLVISR